MRHIETREMRNEVTEITETREIEDELDGVEETEHAHTELAKDDEGELGECLVTRCKQLDSLLQERGEGVCPLEADHDQVGPVVPSELEGATSVDWCTQSLGLWRPQEHLWWR